MSVVPSRWRAPRPHRFGRSGRSGTLGAVVALAAAVAVVPLAATSVSGPDAAAAASAPSAKASYGLFGHDIPKPRKAHTGRAATLGVDFVSSVGGRVTGIQFYAHRANRGPHRGAVWSASGDRLATVRFPASTKAGWRTASFAHPVKVKAGVTYTASYRAPHGHYAVEKGVFTDGNRVERAALVALRGTYAHGVGRPSATWRGANYYVDVVFHPGTGKRPTTSPTPTTDPSTPAPTTPAPTTPPSSGAFPEAGNTGVPDGVALSAYTGPMTITAAGTTIDAKQITGTLQIQAANVTITRSQINGSVINTGSGSVTISDSTVNGGTSENSAIGQRNYTLKRVEVVGARASAGCDANCVIEDSWLHGQYMKPGSDWHGDGFLSNGGSNMTLRHNTLACDSQVTGSGGACSAALAAYGDFSAITNMTVDNNLFASSPAGFCMYGGYDTAKPYGAQAKNIVITNNVFSRGSNGKCAVYGAATAVAPSGSNGNVFSGNTWDDGAAVR